MVIKEIRFCERDYVPYAFTKHGEIRWLTICELYKRIPGPYHDLVLVQPENAEGRGYILGFLDVFILLLLLLLLLFRALI